MDSTWIACDYLIHIHIWIDRQIDIDGQMGGWIDAYMYMDGWMEGYGYTIENINE